MDREDKADDNAEHLYRYVKETRGLKNIYFVLKSSSPDWKRLEDDGFNLLPHGSDEHIAAQMNAMWFVSSHADYHVLWPVPRKNISDLAKYKYVFLQHGVTTNDLSGWLNTKPIRLFVTAMESECKDIAGMESNYIFSDRETIHTGFPRHDSLLKKELTTVKNTILIVPTWRVYLTDESNRVGMRRSKSESFLESDYLKNWLAILQSKRLKELADEHKLEIVFAPHPNMTMYLDDIVLPDYVKAVNVLSDMSYQDLFASARVAVTCFSSAVTEVAYLQTPVVYFHFDRDKIFNGGHVYRKGSFSFEDDGFGPVSVDPEGVLDHLDAALSGREDPIYSKRRDAAFPFRDGKCCERVYQEIEKLSSPPARSR
jgi:hypothetical protein